ncbi:MAG: hypothetical protein IJQ63_04060, partial [Synergistaceae bacterium]|nr:hypothetical protein [Synergistaceae bacterium]
MSKKFENNNIEQTPQRFFNMPEREQDLNIRPKALNEFIGQERLREKLKIYIDAAKGRGEPLDHILFYG